MSTEIGQRIASLSPEQRDRLIQRLRQETTSSGSVPLEGPRMPELPLEPGAPIPLTDLQEVYWIGGSGLFDLGGCGANLYLGYELTSSVWSLADNLSFALRRVIERHAVLRTIVDPDGVLRLLPEVPPFEVEVEDLSRLPDNQIEDRLERVREEMRYARAPMDRWPLFRVVLHQLPEGRLRLHARFDSILFDGRSRGVLMGEIVRLASEPDAELPPLEISFLDHMRALAQHRGSAAWARARDYWMSRLPTLPPLLVPPLARDVSPETVPRQVKRQIRMLEPQAWLQVRRVASRIGVSPTTLLATAFSDALRPWSATPAFTLGLVGSYKPRIHPQIDQVVGNFNTLQLLAVEPGAGSFTDRARRLQQRIAADLDHQAFSGHRVLREWNRRRRTGGQAALPVLFDSFVEYGHAAYRSSGPGEAPRQETAPEEGPGQSGGLTEVDMTLSLPQILLMVVAIEEPDGALTFISQGVEELLSPGSIPDLLDRVQSLLAHLAGDESGWHEESRAVPPVIPAPATELPASVEPATRPTALSPAAPWGPLENKLADLWDEVLGRRPTPDGDHDFFESGGDSLLVTRLLNRAAAHFGLEKPLAAFLRQPTFAHLAELVARAQTETREERRSPFRRLRDSLTALQERILPPPTSPAYGMRIFLLLWFSQFVSGVGTGLGSFALGVWVYRQHASATQYSLFAFVATCTGLLVGPLAGVLADRWDRKRLILLGDSGAAVMTGLMALALYTGRMQLWHVYIIASVMVGFSALQGPAQVAVSSQLVSRRQLGRVSGMTQAAGIATGLICPPLSGALIPLIGFHGVIAIDISTFLFAFVVLVLIRLPRSPGAAEANRERRSVLGDVRFGWDYLRQRPGLLSLLWVFAATNFAVSIVQVLLTPLVLSFGSATNLGFVNAATAAGGLIGSLALSIWGGPRNRMNGILLLVLLQAPILLLGAVKPSVMLIAVACFLFTGLTPLVGGLSQAIWQGKVAHDIQGRVFAMRGLVASLASPLAFLLAGPLADRVFEPLMAPGGALAGTIGQLIGTGKGRGVGLLFMTLGLFIIVVVVLSSLNPRLRKVESELPDAS
jgi:MFS transporter, DHA3 family, macrolide efflux protein